MTLRTFTGDEDRIILDGRAAGRSWTAIGTQLGTTGKACAYHLTRGLGVPDPKFVQVGRSKPQHPPLPAEGRGPLRPGDPQTWGAITAGTVLEGIVYR